MKNIATAENQKYPVLGDMTEARKKETTQNLREEAQKMLERANHIEQLPTVDSQSHEVSTDLKDVASDLSEIADRINLEPSVMVDGAPIDIIPTDVGPNAAKISLAHIGDGRGEKINVQHNDKFTGGTLKSEKRDCSRCAKWVKNHCAVSAILPRKLDGSCEHYVENTEDYSPRYIVDLFCPICHNLLDAMDIAEVRIRSARCFNCETEIAVRYLEFHIRDTKNDYNSNRKIQERNKAAENKRAD